MNRLDLARAYGDKREYWHGASYSRLPWGQFLAWEGVWCPDGIQRNAFPSGDGTADTFFSVPAYVHTRSHGKTYRVYGYVTTETLRGNSVVTEDDPAVLRFVPYRYRKHWALIRGHVDAWCCTDCLVLLANGDVPAEMSEEETAEYVARVDKRTRPYGSPKRTPWDDSLEVTLGRVYGALDCPHTERTAEGDSGEDHALRCEVEEFSSTPCAVCGSPLAGSRHAVTLWQ